MPQIFDENKKKYWNGCGYIHLKKVFIMQIKKLSLKYEQIPRKSDN